MERIKLDRRRAYYLVLDCETATLPFASAYDGADRKKIAIAKPLIYDFGYTIIDKKGKVYVRRNWLVSEIFSVPAVFNTAYYASKRPLYTERLRNKEIDLAPWADIVEQFEADLEHITAVGAYNAMFDFKKAIPFTDAYINQVYGDNYQAWEARQRRYCEDIIAGRQKESLRTFDPNHFDFRGNTYDLFDLWGLSCEHILNCEDYKEQAQAMGWCTASGKYYSTTAEATFRFISNNIEFEEAHTAIDDALIESAIFAIICKATKNKVPMGIEYFPFKILGKYDPTLL